MNYNPSATVVNPPSSVDQGKAPAWFFGNGVQRQFDNIEEALKGLKLNWQVGMIKNIMGKAEAPVKDDNNLNPDDENLTYDREICFDEHRGIYRMDNFSPLAIVGTVYQVIQNDEALSIFDEIIQSGEIRIEGGGVFHKGKRVWVACRLPEDISIGPETVMKYVIISWSHDGSASLTAYFCPYFKERGTMLPIDIPKIVSSISIKHTTNYDSRLKEAKKVLGKAQDYYKALEDFLNDLANESISMDRFNEIIDFLYPDPEEVKLNKDGSVRETAEQKKKESVKEKFRNRDNPFSMSILGIILADAEDSDYGRIRKTKERTESEVRLDSALFGTSKNRKKKTASVVLNFDELKEKADKKKNSDSVPTGII